jgi:putative hydrolase
MLGVLDSMTLLFDLHTHTRYSRSYVHHHAKGTVLENVQAAVKQNIGLGITEHGPGHSLFGLKTKEYPRLKAEIDEANSAIGRKVALLGVEANLMDINGKTDIDMLPIQPEILLMGYHKGVRVRGKAGHELLVPALLTPNRSKALMTEAVINALSRYPIDVLTHPGEYVPIDFEAVAKTAARLGVVMELNNKHPMRVEDIHTALAAGAHFILSSDAHVPENVGMVDRAEAEAKRAKIPKEKIVNSGFYQFDQGLRLDRLRSWAAGLPHFSTGQK